MTTNNISISFCTHASGDRSFTINADDTVSDHLLTGRSMPFQPSITSSFRVAHENKLSRFLATNKFYLNQSSTKFVNKIWFSCHFISPSTQKIFSFLSLYLHTTSCLGIFATCELQISHLSRCELGRSNLHTHCHRFIDLCSIASSRAFLHHPRSAHSNMHVRAERTILGTFNLSAFA